MSMCGVTHLGVGFKLSVDGAVVVAAANSKGVGLHAQPPPLEYRAQED